MSRRGRRPHPDILTPRQWEVLELVRDGLTDAQIAERLGVSVDGAKYHVSEILSKLGVSSREEAAAWQAPERALPGRVVLGGLAVGVIGIAAVTIGVLTWGTAKSGTGDDLGDTIEPPQTVEEFADEFERVMRRGDLEGLYEMYTPEFREQCSLAELEDAGITLGAVPNASIEVVDAPSPAPGEDSSDWYFLLHGSPGDEGINLQIPARIVAEGIWIAPVEPDAGAPLPCNEQFATVGSPEAAVLDFGPPRIGIDHWHAPYEFIACGVRQPNAPTWEGVGIHTHGDGVIHIHPFQAAEEGLGARLVKWFQYGNGVLSEEQVRLPGLETTYENGDACPDGRSGEVQVFANGDPVDLETYIPQEGDQVKVVFGPPDDGVWEGEVQTVDPSGAP